MKFRISEWRPLRRGSLYGFASVVFDGVLQVHGIAIREDKNGQLWAALPSTKWTDKQGKDRYDPIVAFENKDDRDRFATALLAKLRDDHGLTRGGEVVPMRR